MREEETRCRTPQQRARGCELTRHSGPQVPGKGVYLDPLICCGESSERYNAHEPRRTPHGVQATEGAGSRTARAETTVGCAKRRTASVAGAAAVPDTGI